MMSDKSVIHELSALAPFVRKPFTLGVAVSVIYSLCFLVDKMRAVELHNLSPDEL